MFGAFGYGQDASGRQVGANPRYNAQVLGQGAGDQLGLAQVDYAQQQRAQQDALAMYGAAAQGLGPSAAQSMLQQGQEQSRANAMAMAASSRGGGLGGAQRGAMSAQFAGDAQASQAAAQQAAMEQQAAMQGFAGLGMQMGAQAQQQQQMQMGMQQGLLGMQFADDAARRDAAQRGREARSQRNLAWSQFGTGLAGDVLGAIGGGG
jgi:hypothetical protein